MVATEPKKYPNYKEYIPKLQITDRNLVLSMTASADGTQNSLERCSLKVHVASVSIGWSLVFRRWLTKVAHFHPRGGGAFDEKKTEINGLPKRYSEGWRGALFVKQSLTERFELFIYLFGAE